MQSLNKELSRRISIFLSVDRNIVDNYFNPHDPAHLYKRQLRHDFVQYIWDSVHTYKKYSTILYKVHYKAGDENLIDPFMHAVRRHFYVKEQLKRAEFQKFKKRSYRLLVMALFVVMFCQGILPFMIMQQHRIHSALSNSLDVFSWVVLWRPIDRLIFNWNPYLKEISLLHKLANAEIILIQAEEKSASMKTMEVA